MEEKIEKKKGDQCSMIQAPIKFTISGKTFRNVEC